MAIMIHTSTVIVKGHVKGFSGSRDLLFSKLGFRDKTLKIADFGTSTIGIRDFILRETGFLEFTF